MTGASHSPPWPELPGYDAWHATCDTLHAHTQTLGKLAVALAPPEPQLMHAALRLTARGWETRPLPAPDSSGAIVVLLDLRRHTAVVEHSDGRTSSVPLTAHRSVGEVTVDLLGAVAAMVGPVAVNTRPQEVPWTVALDQDNEHATYDEDAVTAYFAAATRAGLALSALRAPYRGRVSPVNAWWGSFDLSISIYSGQPAEPRTDDFIFRNAMNAQHIEIGWWPGDTRFPRPAFFAYATPAPPSLSAAAVAPPAVRWDSGLSEFLFEWADVVAADDPEAAVQEFGRSFLARACAACGWDPTLAASAQGVLPPIA